MFAFTLFAFLLALFVFAINYGYLFVDFQFQVGSFLWGKRLGVKRRSGSVTPLAKVEVPAEGNSGAGD